MPSIKRGDLSTIPLILGGLCDYSDQQNTVKIISSPFLGQSLIDSSIQPVKEVQLL